MIVHHFIKHYYVAGMTVHFRDDPEVLGGQSHFDVSLSKPKYLPNPFNHLQSDNPRSLFPFE
jgi:hypothetical protein